MPEDDPERSAPDESDWSPDPATIPCPDCGAEVSEEADRCPECGHYLSTTDAHDRRPAWYKAAIAFLIGLLIWAFIAWK
jgi:endogenous inhibitor of DNA gyrase (YacG/DUF329 family)